MTDLNLPGESYAHSLIAAGKVDKTSSWSFSADDGNALLGKKGDDWASYGRVHLGLDRGASEKTKARYKYPFAKSGTLYRSALTAIRQRASQQNDAAIFRAAGDLLDLIDKPKAAVGKFECKFTESGADPAGTFEGYGAVFNNEDDGGDMLLPGCCSSTLAQHKSAGTMPKMLLQHGSMGINPFGGNDPMADVPIGKWTMMAEDGHGLQVKGRLINLDTERGKTIYGAMKEGELNGLSIGYKATDFVRGTKPNEPRRQVKAINLFEVSPVTFPMNRLARVGSVKTFPRIGTIREFEDFLRDAGGFSRAAAREIALCGFKASDPRDEDDADIATIIRRNIATLTTR